MKGRRCWRFGHAEFDEGALELRVDNRLVSVQRKPLELLMHLLDHAGSVVTKEQLIGLAWPRRIVTETVLAKAIGKLRAALSDETQAFIKTVHGYGYRFAAAATVSYKPGPTTVDGEHETVRAVADLLTQHVPSAPESRPLPHSTLVQLLHAIAQTLPKRVDGMPAVAAQIHAALASCFWQMERFADAQSHLDKALMHLDATVSVGSKHALPARDFAS